ncbi:hypothetical protein SDC9_188628 [bioreactor metagenome]|uniref:Uncharacterized protein n=1 Tax=bioreactor metagenome TaxID=1076179 RepID=A0A645HQ35_9ZZZZ
MIHYVERSLVQLAARISIAMRMEKLEAVFPCSKQPQNKPRLIFSFGIKMEDEEYRALVDELLSCRFWEDKLKLIKRRVHSLADLEEIVIDAELTETESMAMLQELGPVEIAALYRRHLKGTEFEDLEQNDATRLFRDTLRALIAQQPQIERDRIRRAAEAMED